MMLFAADDFDPVAITGGVNFPVRLTIGAADVTFLPATAIFCLGLLRTACPQDGPLTGA